MATEESKDPFLRILVTGGCGFLGSHLCRRLVNEGHEVVAVDNFFTSQKTNVKDLLDKPNFEIIRHDITKEFFIEVDQIYNMACPASPVHYQYNPVKTMKTSVIGTMNMLGLAKRVKGFEVNRMNRRNAVPIQPCTAMTSALRLDGRLPPNSATNPPKRTRMSTHSSMEPS